MDEVCLKDNYCDDGLPPLFLTKFILGILIIRWYSNDCKSIGVIRGQTTKWFKVDLNKCNSIKGAMRGIKQKNKKGPKSLIFKIF